MSKVAITQSKLDALANAISLKSGETVPLTLDEMVQAVDGIETGGAVAPVLQSKELTVDGAGTLAITADSGYDGLSLVEVEVPDATLILTTESGYSTTSGVRTWSCRPVGSTQPVYGGSGGWLDSATYRGNSAVYNAVPKNTTITPTTSSQTIGGSDWHMEGAVTVAAMPTGTAGTPSATKGSVSNHSVTVTPSVTNTAGYISGGTLTGTAVTVSASELVSGSETKTQNGTYDVTNLASLVVNVSGGGGGSTAQWAQTSTDQYNATSSIQIGGLNGEPTTFILYYDDGAITPSATPQICAVVFDGTNLHGQTITNTSNAQVTYDGSSFSKSYSNGILTITSTGANFQAGIWILDYSYGGASGNIYTEDVQVGSGATSITFTGLEDEPLYWSCIFKSNFSTSSGYQRVIFTRENEDNLAGACMDSSTHISITNWTSSYSNGSLTITSQGTNQGGYFHQPGYYQLTAVYETVSPYQKKTVTPTTSQQIVEADTGYDALSRVTVNPIPSEYVIPTGNLPITSNGTNINVSQYATVSVNVSGGGGSVNVATTTWQNTDASATTHTFSSLSGTPKAAFLRCTTSLSRSSSSSNYYVADMRWTGTATAGNSFRRSNGTYANVTSGYSASVNGSSITFTTTGTSTTNPGSFYNGTYELCYVY